MGRPIKVSRGQETAAGYERVIGGSEAAQDGQAAITSPKAGLAVTSAPRCRLPTTEATRTAFKSVERQPFEGRGELVISRGQEATESLRPTARLVGLADATKAAPNAEPAVRGLRQRETFSPKASDTAGVAITTPQQTETKEMACCAMANEAGRMAVESPMPEVC